MTEYIEYSCYICGGSGTEIIYNIDGTIGGNQACEICHGTGKLDWLERMRGGKEYLPLSDIMINKLAEEVRKEIDKQIIQQFSFYKSTNKDVIISLAKMVGYV